MRLLEVRLVKAAVSEMGGECGSVREKQNEEPFDKRSLSKARLRRKESWRSSE